MALPEREMSSLIFSGGLLSPVCDGLEHILQVPITRLSRALARWKGQAGSSDQVSSEGLPYIPVKDCFHE